MVLELLSRVWLFVTPVACSMPGSRVLNYLPEFSSILSTVDAKEHFPAPWVSYSLSTSESVTKVSCIFVSLIFTLNQNYILKNYHLPSHEDMGSLHNQRKYLHKIHRKILHSKFLKVLGASLIAQLVKNPSAVQETPVQFLGQKDPLEKGKATHSKILAWRIPWTVQSMKSQRVRHNWTTFT